VKRIAAGLLAFAAMCSCQPAFSTVGSWTTQAGPPAPITTNNVVALADGRVAIFGGLSLQTGQESAQTVLYDPVQNTWTSGAPMPGPAFPDVVAPLRDGTVLVEGGLDTRTDTVSGATWLYDPARNSWSRAGDVLEPRAGPSFTVLSDGRVLIAGGNVALAQPVTLPNGSVSNTQEVTSAEIFDPQTRIWSRAGRLGTARGGFALVPLPDGGALAAGGCVQTNVFPAPGLTAAEVFDGATGSWSATTPLPAPTCRGTGVMLRDGRVLLLDQTLLGNSSNDAFLYDPKNRAWSAAGALAGGGSAALVLSDGRVFVPEVQPSAPQGHVFKDLVGGQIFDPATNQWTYVTTTSVPLPLVYLYSGGLQISVALRDGSAVVILQTVALAFHPQDAPPTTQLLDSTGLTTVLLAIALVIGLLMLLAYRRASRIDVSKLA
jgi:Galactose oxidase, central domain